MKKLLNCALMFALILSCFAFVGCLPEENPYIRVEGLKTEYQVGESLYIGSSKVYYYADTGSERYVEVDLTADMVSEFSTTSAGTFTMKITFNKVSLDVEYVVLGNGQGGGNQGGDQGGDNGGNNGGNNGGQEFPSGSLTEQQALSVIEQALAKMVTYAEIKSESTSVSTVYGEYTTYKIATQTKAYSYNGENDRSWIIKENNNLYMYEITQQFGEVYNKYVLNTSLKDVRQYMYSDFTDIIAEIDFVEASKSGDRCVIEYAYTQGSGPYSYSENYTITIENNEIKSMVINTSDEAVVTIIYTYYTQETNTIPSVPNVTWSYKGIYYGE